MPAPHTPKPEIMIYAVARIFNISPTQILSVSQNQAVVVPREVCAFIMQNVGFMRIPEISEVLNLDAGWVKKIIRNVRDRARVDTEFSRQIWESQQLILGLYIQ